MSEHPARQGRRTSRSPLTWVVLAAVALLVALVVGNLAQSRAQASHLVPQSAAMEDALGVRFSRVAVVGDGGLLTVSYVVLDAEKATRFQSDSTHPPVLRSEARDGSTRRVSIMKQGHRPAGRADLLPRLREHRRGAPGRTSRSRSSTAACGCATSRCCDAGGAGRRPATPTRAVARALAGWCCCSSRCWWPWSSARPPRPQAHAFLAGSNPADGRSSQRPPGSCGSTSASRSCCSATRIDIVDAAGTAPSPRPG